MKQEAKGSGPSPFMLHDERVHPALRGMPCCWDQEMSQMAGDLLCHSSSLLPSQLSTRAKTGAPPCPPQPMPDFHKAMMSV